MSEILREELEEELIAFVSKGNGLITGVPGIGKSHILEKINTTLNLSRTPSLIIRVDSLAGASDYLIGEYLDLNSNTSWSDYLLNIYEKVNKKGVLIIDAFDAARDEKLRMDLITFFLRASKILKGKWNLIVSCRTYDANKSPKLLNIFPDEVDNSLTNSFEIPKLKENELERFFEENQLVKEIYCQGSQKLKNVLSIPFFIWLLEQVVESEDISSIKRYSTEEELLSYYWRKKILNQENGSDLAHLLNKMSEKILEFKKMELPKGKLISDSTNLQHIETLIREGVWEWADQNENAIRFTHHILFDYAISNLFMSTLQGADDIKALIEKDKSISFFYKPSLIYFFTNKWTKEKKKEDLSPFWEWLLNLLNSSSFINLFLQIVPISVVAFEADSEKDFDYLFTKALPEKSEIIFNYYLQGLQFLRVDITQEHLQLFEKLIKSDVGVLSLKHLWAISNLIDLVLDNPTRYEFDEIESDLGVVSRSILDFVFTNRGIEGINLHAIDRLGAYFGVKFVARTFETNPQESKNLLRKTLDLLGDFNSDYISYFSTLTTEIASIISCDIEFALKIFNDVYFYKEQDSSFNETGGIVVSFRMRKSDLWRNCHFRLNQAFLNSLLDICPKEAIRLALDVALKCPPRSYFENLEENGICFILNGIKAQFIPDGSQTWDYSGNQSYTYSDPIYINQYTIEFLEKNIEDPIKFETYFIEYIQHSKAAFSWKKILELGIKYPNNNLINQYLFEFISNPDLLTRVEIQHTSIDYIQKRINSFSDNELEYLEELVIDLKDNYPKEIEAYKRLLLSLGKFKITSEKVSQLHDELINSIDENDEDLQNKEPFSISIVRKDHIPKVYFKSKEVEVENLTRDIADIRNFNQLNINSIPSRLHYISILEKAYNLFTICYSSNRFEFIEGADFELLTDIVRTVSIILRNHTTLLEEEYLKVGEILSYASDENNNVHWRKATELNELFYSPTPLTECARAYPRFYHLKKENSLQKILLLSKHQDATIRLQIAFELWNLWSKSDDQLFWQILDERIETETNNTVLTVLILSNLSNEVVWSEHTDRVLSIIQSKKDIWMEDKNSDKIIELVLGIAKQKDNDIAKKILDDLMYDNHVVATVVFNVYRNYLYFLGDDNFYSWFLGYVDRVLSLYREKLNHNLALWTREQTEEERKKIKELLNENETPFRELVLRSFFALDVNNKSSNNNLRAVQLNDSEKKYWYFRFKPVLIKVIEEAKQITDTIETGVIFPSTAYYFIQILTRTIEYDSREVLYIAKDIIELSSKMKFNTDNSALRETTKFVDVLLADYKWVIQNDNDALDSLVYILDRFAESGYPEALKRIWSLDEIFR